MNSCLISLKTHCTWHLNPGRQSLPRSYVSNCPRFSLSGMSSLAPFSLKIVSATSVRPPLIPQETCPPLPLSSFSIFRRKLGCSSHCALCPVSAPHSITLQGQDPSVNTAPTTSTAGCHGVTGRLPGGISGPAEEWHSLLLKLSSTRLRQGPDSPWVTPSLSLPSLQV